jgi:uncharacterized peroxidase-related enzyme
LSHAQDFGRESHNDELARQLIFDFRKAKLAPADRALCEFAVKLTLTPGAMREADLDVVREHGFDDAAITVATQVIAYFNYINRVADALEVDDEAWFDLTRSQWLAKKGRDYAA